MFNILETSLKKDKGKGADKHQASATPAVLDALLAAGPPAARELVAYLVAHPEAVPPPVTHGGPAGLHLRDMYLAAVGSGYTVREYRRGCPDMLFPLVGLRPWHRVTWAGRSGLGCFVAGRCPSAVADVVVPTADTNGGGRDLVAVPDAGGCWLLVLDPAGGWKGGGA
jgi:hypothetical protein